MTERLRLLWLIPCRPVAASGPLARFRRADKRAACRYGLLTTLLILGSGRAPAAGPGVISGKLDKAGVLTAARAVNRDEPDRKYPGEVDAKSGAFVIKGLPLGATYDVVLEAGPAILEGVNLKVMRSDFEEEQPLKNEDVEAIKKAALSLNKFENKVEVLGVFGNVQHAAVVLNKVRTEAFINSNPGEMIWRLEVWRFERPDETWIKRQDELATVHYRKRMQKTDFAKIALTLEPALGGIELTEKKPEVKLTPVAAPATEPGVRLRGK
jgi:hypothetical protein